MYMDTQPVRTLSTNVYIIPADSAQLEQLMYDENINFIDNYHPHYKLEPQVFAAYNNQEIDLKTKIQLVFSPFAQPVAIQGVIKSDIIKPDKVTKEGKYYTIDGLNDREQIFDYAMNPLISEIRLAPIR